jgi:transcriptional regulator with XRE-family HTH domain
LSETHNGREQFGNRLRLLREQTRLNGKQFAERLGWAASKVSRIETGRQTATADDVAAWVEAVGGSAELLEELLTELRAVRFEYATWKRQLRAGTAPRQRASIGLEASATSIRAFQPAMIPGLLQTAEYARQVLANLVTLHGTPNDVAEGVRMRMQRQEALYNPDKHFRFLLTEAALRYQPGPASTLVGQLDRLLAVAGLETVELSVVPHGVPWPTPPLHGFWIFDEALVLVETLSAELALRDEETAVYFRVFDAMWGLAAHGEDASVLVSRAIREIRAIKPVD